MKMKNSLPRRVCGALCVCGFVCWRCVVTSDKVSSRDFTLSLSAWKPTILSVFMWRHSLESWEISHRKVCVSIDSQFSRLLKISSKTHMFFPLRYSPFHQKSSFVKIVPLFRTVQTAISIRRREEKGWKCEYRRGCLSLFRMFLLFFFFGMLISLIRVRERIRLSKRSFHSLADTKRKVQSCFVLFRNRKREFKRASRFSAYPINPLSVSVASMIRNPRRNNCNMLKWNDIFNVQYQLLN